MTLQATLYVLQALLIRRKSRYLGLTNIAVMHRLIFSASCVPRRRPNRSTANWQIFDVELMSLSSYFVVRLRPRRLNSFPQDLRRIGGCGPCSPIGEDEIYTSMLGWQIVSLR